MSKKVAVIYHSGHGNTKALAEHVVTGARQVEGVEISLLQAEDIATRPEALVEFDGLIWGSPTYLGGVSGQFKMFMDATGRLWRNQQLKGKLASGFTVSALPSGDKQSTLISMFVFSMQHGMLWVGNPFLPEQSQGEQYDQAANRLGSWTGLMAQAGHIEGNSSFVDGDIRTARMFGENFSLTLNKHFL